MAINFPSGPSINQLYSFSDKTWQWNGVYWEVYSALTSYITSVYSVGSGVSSISGVSNGNVALKSFSGSNITIIDGGDKLTFINPSPDQTVTITGGTNIQIAGSYPNFGINFTGTTGVSGNYLSLSGGTVTGETIFQSGLTANTISATTISGGTFYGDGSNLTGIANIYNSDGVLTGNRTLSGASNDLTFADLNVFKTTSGGTDIGLKLDFASQQYILGTNNNFVRINENTNIIDIQGLAVAIGDVFSFGNQTIFSVDDINEITKSTYLGNDIGLKLDFANNIYSLGTDAAGYGISGFWLDWNNCNNYIGDGANNYEGVNLQVNNNPKIIKTQYNAIDVGLKLDFANSTYSLGDFNNTSGSTKIVIDDTAQTITLSNISAGTDSNVLTIDNLGAVHYIDLSGITKDYLPLSGGTVTGETIFQSGLTANTISATTYQNLPQSATTYVTGFTYSANTLTISDSSGNTFNATINTVTGLTANTISQVDYIDFNLSANPIFNEGRLHWDSDNKTLQIDTDVNGVEIEVGHENVVRVVNKTNTTLLKGELVYINGAQGQRPTVTRADYSGDSTSTRTLGFVAADINNNNNGYVITYGMLRGVNTLAYSAGTQLYLFTGGTWTNIRPVAPKHEVRVGVVVDQNATTGIIFVSVMNGYELQELHDVSATTLNNLDVLQWNSSEDVWQPTSNPKFNSVSATTISGVTSTFGTISATTISGGTFYGDGRNLQGVPKYYAEPSTPPPVNPSVTGTSSIAIGSGAEASGNNVLSFGQNAGSGSTYNDNSIFFGLGAGANSTSYLLPFSMGSIFIGLGAGEGAIDSGSIAIGGTAGLLATNSGGNIFLGGSSGLLSNNNGSSIFIGGGSGNLSSGITFSNFIGQGAGDTSYQNVKCNFIGQQSGFYSSGNTETNYIGLFTGGISSGNTASTFIGRYVGSNINNGTNNLIIGDSISLPNGVSNSINLGGVLFGINTYYGGTGSPVISNTPTVNGKIGIGVVTPLNRLHVEDTSNPLRLVGLQTLNTDTEVLTTDTNGVIHKRPYDFVTGFTYASSSSTFTIRTSSGNTFNANINAMTGLTVNGDLTVTGNYVVSGNTIISGNTIFSGATTLQSVNNGIGDFLTIPSGGTVTKRTSDQVRDDIGYYGLTFAISNGYY